MRFSIQYTCVSHIGNVRKMNQDNFICNKLYMEAVGKNIQLPLFGVKSTDTPLLFGVFDGMGGEECGEIAAYIAAKNASSLEIGKDVVSDLEQFCKKTNADICEYAESNMIPAMGTTAAMLAFTCKDITLCNIGDSKIFRFCDGVLEQISKDHVASTAFGMKPPLSQNLGIPPTELVIEPYFSKGLYNNNDVYIICSDGLTDMVTIEETQEVLNTKPVEEATQELLERALRNGGRDNITIIICKIKREPQWLSKLKIMLNI